jgi:hypothetical protein
MLLRQSHMVGAIHRFAESISGNRSLFDAAKSQTPR